jgi:ribosome-associated protein
MLRLANLIRSVLIPPKKRVATKPTFGSVQRRLQAKQQRSAVKQTRHIKPDTE